MSDSVRFLWAARRPPGATLGGYIAAGVCVVLGLGLSLMMITADEIEAGVVLGGFGFAGLGLLVGVLTHSSDDTARKKWDALQADWTERWGANDCEAMTAGAVWLGESADAVAATLGRPVAVDEQVLKTKTKHTWKYQPMGVGRFGVRIIIEDGFVVGWKVNG